MDVEQVEQGAVLDAGDERAVKIRAGMEEMKVCVFAWVANDELIAG